MSTITSIIGARFDSEGEERFGTKDDGDNDDGKQKSLRQRAFTILFFFFFFVVVVPRGRENERGRGGGGRRGGRGKSDENDEKSVCVKNGVVATSGFWIVENRRARAEDERNMAEDYDAYSQTYDNLDGNKIVVETLGIDQLRTKMFERVEGDVLELAVGTGLNLPYYFDKKEGRRRVKSLTAIDLSSGMLKKAEEKFREIERDSADNNNVKFELANVESLPYKDETFDYVVDTFSMCVFEKPDVALQEAKRVLKKGGKLLLFEHSRAKANTVLSAYQHATSGMVKRMAKGCDWSQDVEKIVREAGFTKVVGTIEQVGGLIETLEVKVTPNIANAA